MSFDDDRDMYGNHRSHSYSADEAFNAGARPWDAKYEVDFKVNQARKKQWEWVSPDSPSVQSTSYSYSGGGGGILFLYLVALSLIGAFWFTLFDGLTHFYIRESEQITTDVSLSYIASQNKEKWISDESRKDAIQLYRHLYRDDTDLSKIFEYNLLKNEMGLDGYAALAYKPLAKDPATYDTEFCKVKLRYAGERQFMLPSPEFKLSKPKVYQRASYRKADPVFCKVTNWEDIQSALGTKQKVLGTLCGIGFLITVIAVIKGINRLFA